MDKESLQRRARYCDFSMKYISLPCMVLSGVLALYGLYTGNSEIMVLNAGMLVFNFFSYQLNSVAKERLLDAAASFDEHDRQQKIRDLNPHKK